MPQFIDRRLNPRDKNLGNRMRFLKRTRARIKQAVDKAVRERSIGEATKGGSVSIPTDGIDEPHFRLSGGGGDRERVLPGNKEFVSGDRIQKPSGGRGGSGTDASDSGGGEDAFSFALTEEEFLDILFDDLELPDLVKASLKDVKLSEYRRAGYSNDGTTPNLNVSRTMRHSMSRRLALRRPTSDEIRALEDELTELRQNDLSESAKRQRVPQLFEEIQRLKRLQAAIPFIDPIDVRYNRFTRVTLPRAKAVMFCLMDVSASMGEREKDLAKRFFILLHLFLKRKYDRVDIVFIRHTHEASEVDERNFSMAGNGRNGRQFRVRGNDRHSRGALPRGGMEYLLRPGVRRGQFERRHRALHRTAGADHFAALAIFRLYRDRRSRRKHAMGRQGVVARLFRARRERAQLRDEASDGARRHLPRLSRALRQTEPKGSHAMTSAIRRAPSGEAPASGHLFEGAEWNFPLMQRVYAAVQGIALDDLGLNVFPNQIEIISAEQMLDAYSSVGMPLMYSHWSYGKRFVRDEMLYRKGYQALAYEIVINSNPCISYYMEENTMAMQTLVLAHAAFGHNHFFKNNYLFQQWTDPNGILDYLEFAKRYVAECEERHGVEAVESVLDAAHALMNQGVFRYRRATKLKLGEYERRRRERLEGTGRNV